MSLTRTRPADVDLSQSPLDEATRRPRTSSAATWWAAVGAVFAAVTVYQWSAWLLGGNLQTNPRRGPVPGWQLAVARVEETIGPLLVIGVLYWCLWRPWRRERRITLDGLLVVVFLQMWALQDPWIDFLRPWSVYSTVWTSVGCPQCHAPGWLSPHTMSEPVLFMPGAYAAVLFGGVVLGNKVMRTLRARRPGLSTPRLVLRAFLLLCLLDFVMETVWLTTGAYTYGGAHRGLSLWAGRYYQFPVYEVLLWGITWTGLACVRYFRDDKGRTVAERGVDELRIGSAGRAGVRLLALMGICNLLFLAYNISVNYAGLYGDAYPRSILSRPYLTGNMCGTYTDVACPGPDVPIRVSR
jgi:hypothetical protein